MHNSNSVDCSYSTEWHSSKYDWQRQGLCPKGVIGGQSWTKSQQWECKQPCEGQAALPEGVVNGKDPEPHPHNGNSQKDRGGKGLCDVAPAADAPQELLHEGDVAPKPPVAPAEPDLHASLTPPADIIYKNDDISRNSNNSNIKDNDDGDENNNDAYISNTNHEQISRIMITIK